jgi:dihydroorotase-like cyclic amidohydrolase
MPRIDKMFAFIAEDNGPEDEGVCAFQTPGGMWFPLVGADMKRVDSLRKIAVQICEESGKPIHLVEFSVRREIEVIEPAREIEKADLKT